MKNRLFQGFSLSPGDPKYGTADMLTPIFSTTKVVDGLVLEVLEYGRPILPNTVYRRPLFRIMNEAHREFERVLIERGDL